MVYVLGSGLAVGPSRVKGRGGGGGGGTGPELASLVKNDRAAATSNEASTRTFSAPKDPSAGIPSSDGAQASLGAS